jgi:hypothetical protein
VKLNLRLGMLVATVVLLIVGCSSVDDSRSDAPVVTRIMAAVGGILVERDGCLRFAQDASSDSPSEAIIWQRDIFEFERTDDELRIHDIEYGDIVWKFGERVRTSGGHYSFWEEFASEEFLQRCAEPYVFVSGARRDSEPGR